MAPSPGRRGGSAAPVLMCRAGDMLTTPPPRTCSLADEPLACRGGAARRGARAARAALCHAPRRGPPRPPALSAAPAGPGPGSPLRRGECGRAAGRREQPVGGPALCPGLRCGRACPRDRLQHRGQRHAASRGRGRAGGHPVASTAAPAGAPLGARGCFAHAFGMRGTARATQPCSVPQAGSCLVGSPRPPCIGY